MAPRPIHHATGPATDPGWSAHLPVIVPVLLGVTACAVVLLVRSGSIQRQEAIRAQAQAVASLVQERVSGLIEDAVLAARFCQAVQGVVELALPVFVATGGQPSSAREVIAWVPVDDTRATVTVAVPSTHPLVGRDLLTDPAWSPLGLGALAAQPHLGPALDVPGIPPGRVVPVVVRVDGATPRRGWVVMLLRPERLLEGLALPGQRLDWRQASGSDPGPESGGSEVPVAAGDQVWRLSVTTVPPRLGEVLLLPLLVAGLGLGATLWLVALMRGQDRRTNRAEQQARQNELELAGTRTLVRTVFATSPDLHLVCDVEGRAQLANEAFLLAAGRELTALVADPWVWLPPDQAARLRQGQARAVAARACIITDLDLIVSGGPRWCHVVHTRLPGPEGGVVAVLTTVADHSARRRAEVELQRRADMEARYRGYIDHAPVGLLVGGRDGRIVEVNAATCAITGLSEVELLGRPVLSLAHPDDAERAQEMFTALLTTGRARGLVRQRRTDDRIGYSEIAAVALADGRLMGFINDVTERVETEAALRRARDEAQDARLALERAVARAERLAEAAQQGDRAKNEFLAAMSHEIRTPLNGVVGMTELLLASRLGFEQEEFAQTIARSARSLLLVLGEVLDWARIEAGQLDLEQADFALPDLVHAVVADHRPQTAANSLRLLVEVAPRLPALVTGDATRLRQVLDHLVGNAVKFTARGWVQVTVAAGPDVGVRVVVADTGPGIPLARRAELFRPFVQLDPGAARHHGGAGLGLAITQRLVEAMGGAITVGESPQGGASFTVDLPLAHAAPPVPAWRPLAGQQVLVADGCAPARAQLAHDLGIMGAEVLTAEDGPSALHQLASASLEGRVMPLTIVERHLPGMDAIALGRAVAAEPALSAAVLVLAAPSSSAALAEVANAAACTAVLLLPATPHDLLEVIARARTGRRGLPPTTAVIRRLGAELPPLAGRILLVEDHPVNQRLAELMLRQLGLTPILIGDGNMALEVMQREPFAAVLLDCHLPGLDGYQVARLHRAQETGRRLPIIAVTADALPADRARALAAGMDDHLAKPFTLEQLRAMLAKHLGEGSR